MTCSHWAEALGSHFIGTDFSSRMQRKKHSAEVEGHLGHLVLLFSDNERRFKGEGTVSSHETALAGEARALGKNPWTLTLEKWRHAFDVYLVARPVFL